MNKQQQNEDLKQILTELSEEGFQCFMQNDPTYCYGFMITPSDNIIYIEHDYFYGWNLSLKYVPSKQNGSGCRCNEKPLTEITAEIILEQEQEGLKFARKLRAKLYKSSDEYLNKLWNFDKMEEI